MTGSDKSLSFDLQNELYAAFRANGCVTGDQASELAQIAQQIIDKRLSDLLGVTGEPAEIKLDPGFTACLSQMLSPGKR